MAKDGGGNVRPADCLRGRRVPLARYATKARTASPLTIVVLFGGVCFAVLSAGSRAQAQADTGPAVQSPSIAIFVSSRKDQCYDNGIAGAIEQLTKAEQKRVNASGGILRRTLHLQFLD